MAETRHKEMLIALSDPKFVFCRATTQLQLEGVIASAAHCDVTNKAEVDALVNWTVQTYGAIDLLVANAGIVKGADFLDMSEQDFDDVVRVNLKGVFLVSQHKSNAPDGTSSNIKMHALIHLTDVAAIMDETCRMFVADNKAMPP